VKSLLLILETVLKSNLFRSKFIYLFFCISTVMVTRVAVTGVRGHKRLTMTCVSNMRNKNRMNMRYKNRIQQHRCILFLLRIFYYILLDANC